LSLIREEKLLPQTVWELKSAAIKKGGLLTLHRGKERFADLGGLDPLKQFSLRLFSRRNPIATPRGFMLLGLPGVGKSFLALALGNELGLPTLTLDVGSLMGGTVGSTEQNTRTALQTLRAMAPCLCFVDELDKAFAGIAAGGQGDSGVLARLFGSLLTFLSDDTSGVFFIATANDISRLPPEMIRSERFDAIWFLDLPAASEKQKIWELYLRKFQLAELPLPRDVDWTGAEIRSCCRLAALMDVPLAEAAKNIVPVAVTAAESVEKLRTWAAGRCLDASRGGIYVRGAAAPSASGRRVARASAN
jgi:SpoVK/Ycf46/Vps4 family AAA+-type ATPase